MLSSLFPLNYLNNIHKEHQKCQKNANHLVQLGHPYRKQLQRAFCAKESFGLLSSSGLQGTL